MKFVRPLLITLGIITLVLAAGLGLAMVPGVQRWAVLRAAAGQPGLKLEVGSVAAGFSSVTLRDVSLEQNGLRVQLEQLEADYSPGQFLLRRRLVIHELTATGLMVDASRLARSSSGPAAAGSAVAAPGLLGRLVLPVALELADCRVTGRARLPGADGQPSLEADFRLSGGKIAPGQQGSLLLSATVRNPASGAHVAALNIEASLRVTQTTERTFDRVILTAVVDAEGKTFSDQNQLKISAELARDGSWENYSASVDTLIRGVAANLLTLQAGLTAGQPEYAGRWTLNASAPQLDPFVLGIPLPDFEVQGKGQFSANPATPAVSLQGSLAGSASRLEAIAPAWQAIGAIKLDARFDVAGDDKVLRLRQLELALAGDRPVLDLHAASAAEFTLRDRRLKVGGLTEGDVLSLQLYGVPVAWVRPFVRGATVAGGMITGRLVISAGPDRLLLRSPEPLRVDSLDVMLDGRPVLTKAEISLNPELALSENDLQGTITALTLNTPAGDHASVRVNFTAPFGGAPAVAIATSGTADLPDLLSPWLPWGRVTVRGESDFTLTAGRRTMPGGEAGPSLAPGGVSLRNFSLSILNPAGTALVQVQSLRPFDYDLGTRQVAGHAAAAADLVRITLGPIPLGNGPGLAGSRWTGTVAQGAFVVAGGGDKVSVRGDSPFRMTGISLVQDGRPALAGLTVEAAPGLDLSGGTGGHFQTGDVVVRDGGGAVLATGKGDGTSSPEAGVHGSLTFGLELPPLAAQPLFAGTETVAQGRASGEIRFALAAASQVEARVTLNGLVASAGAQSLPVANVSIRAIEQPNGKLSIQVPVLLDRGGQRSDLNLALDLTPAGRTFVLDGRVTGEHLDLDDALSLLGVFLSSAAAVDGPAQPADAGAVVVADPLPAWSRFTGQVVLDIKSITRGKDWAMTGLAGEMGIEPARITLRKLSAAFGAKGRFEAKGALGFNGGPQPYDLAGDFSLSEFDAGKFFRALEPAKSPTVEGIFTVKAQLSGRGATPGQAGAQARGRFELTSRQGVFRGLQRASDKVSMTSRAVELGASVFGSIFGSDKVTKAAEKVAGSAYFVDQFAQSVAELPYDQLSLRLVRDDSLNVALEDISLISPEIRLLGQGTVTYVATKPLLEQPLSLTMTFSGRGKIEQLLGKLRLLDGTRDELGYAKTQLPVTVAGSLAKPDPSAFFTKVATAKLSEILAPGN